MKIKKHLKYLIVIFILLLMVICGSLILRYTVFWPWNFAIAIPIMGVIGGPVVVIWIGALFKSIYAIRKINKKQQIENENNTDITIGEMGWILLCIPCVAGFVVFGIQIFFFLKAGVWIEMSVLYPFYKYWEWAYFPNDWVGLHDILQTIPLSLALIFIPIGAGYLVEIIFHD